VYTNIDGLFCSFFCRSSTGKSTLVKAVLARLPRKCSVQLLQVRPSEVKSYTDAHSNTRAIESVSLVDGLSKVEPNSFVIIEDIVVVRRSEEEALRLLLNYRAHHDNLRVVCVAHMLYRNMLLTLLPMFNYIVFTHTETNRQLISIAARKGFHLEPATVDVWLTSFSGHCSTSSGKAGGFFYITCATVEFHRAGGLDPGAPSDETITGVEDVRAAGAATTSTAKQYVKAAKKSKQTLKKGPSMATSVVPSNMSEANVEHRFASCFTNHDRSAEACAFFSLIVSVLIKQVGFRSTDLTLAFSQSRKQSKRSIKRISLVDYVCSLLESRPTHAPALDHLVLHRFLCSKIKIPKVFIRNAHFYSIASDLTSDESISSTSNDDDDDDDDDKIHL